jgi:glycine dehydrogenase subunit 1
MVTAATIHMSVLGPEGLRAAALASHANTGALLDRVAATGAARRLFRGPFFHEAVVRLDAPVGKVSLAMAAQGVLAGYDLGQDYPELGNCLLVCATEKRAPEDVEAYGRHLEGVMTQLGAAA